MEIQAAKFESLMRRLQERSPHRPVPAVEIAALCGADGSRETRRRRVRSLVQMARLAGLRICAESRGYWLARSDAEWKAYCEAVKNKAIYKFVALAKQQKAANETRNGQGKLFDMTPIFAG